MDLITPEKVRHKLDSSEEVVIVDLPDLLDFEADPRLVGDNEMSLLDRVVGSKLNCSPWMRCGAKSTALGTRSAPTPLPLAADPDVHSEDEVPDASLPERDIDDRA